MKPADEPISWTPESLVAHNARLRGLAVRLAGETDADDLVQEAWGAALRHSGTGVESPGAWLSGVVRNLAQMMRRGEARRRRREQIVARGEALASPEIAVARVELHREIADAVLGLPEVSRQVVILRFFENLSPAEIAEHLGVPAATVRTRLHRALERLRVRLDAVHGGERSAWAAMVLPGALVREAGATGARAVAAKSLVKGVIAVSTKKLLAGTGIALALVALGIVVWRDQGPDGGRESMVGELLGTEGEGPRPREVRPAGTSPIPTEPFAPPTEGDAGTQSPARQRDPKMAIVRGSVRIRGVGPLREGRVFLWGYDQAGDDLDEDGNFRIETRTTHARSLFWSKDGVQMTLPCDVRPSLETETVVDVEIAAGTTLEGHVVSAASGAGINGASVTLRAPHADDSQQAEAVFLESGDDGSLRVPHVPYGEFQLEIEHPEFTAATVPFQMPRERPLVVELEPGCPLVITLANYEHYRRFDEIALRCNAFEVDPQGVERHTGVSVMLEGRPDEEGRMTVNAPSPGIWTYDLFSYGGFPRQRGRLVIPEGTAPVKLEVRLPIPGTVVVSGRVRDGAGEPISGASLKLGSAVARLDTDGSYLMAEVQAGRRELNLVVGSGDESVESSLGTVDVPECEAFSHDVRLPGTGRIVVTLADVPSELRVEHFWIRLQRLDDPAGEIAWGIGSPDETMAFSWLAPGRYRLSPRFDTLSLADRDIVIPGDGDEIPVELRLGAGVAITFHIRVPFDARLPATVNMQSPPEPGLGPDSEAPRRVTTTLKITSEGLGRTALFLPGRHDVSFSAAGFRTTTLRIEVDPQRKDPVEVTLEPER